MKVRICMGSNCVMMGSMTILNQIEDLKETMNLEDLEIENVKCFGYCKNDNKNVGPVVEVDGKVLKNVTSEDVMSLIMKEQTEQE